MSRLGFAMTSPRISLCMIVKDEAEALPICLGSLAAADPEGWITERIILDTGSSDETVAIAQDLNCQVFHYEWNDDFAAARNSCISHATGDWLLVLDADEQLIDQAFSSLRPLLQQPNIIAINLLRQEVGAAQSPYSMVSRLFRRHSELEFRRPYHAMVDDSMAELLQKESGWKVVDASHIAIRHEGYQAGAIAAQNKFTRARQAMEGFLKDHPKDGYCCAKLGALYGEEGNWSRGISLLNRGLKSTELDAPSRYELHYHLAIGHRQLGNVEAAAQAYQAALEVAVPDIIKLGTFNNFASLLQAEGLPEMARSLYEQAITIDPNFATAHYNLGKLKREQGDLAGAIAAYETALSLTPNAPEIHQNLGVALLKTGALDQSRSAFERAIALYEVQQPSQAEALRRQLGELNLFPPGQGL